MFISQVSQPCREQFMVGQVIGETNVNYNSDQLHGEIRDLNLMLWLKKKEKKNCVKKNN